MSWELLSVYAVASLLLALSPGPTMLLTFSHAMHGGLRVALCGMLGASTGSSTLIAVAAAGLGALLAASHTLFEAVRWAGVAYLCWIGWRIWRSEPPAPVTDSASPGAAAAAPRHGAGRAAYLRSLGVALSNPKTVLFFGAFLPQFIDPAAPVTPQYVWLGVVFVLIDSLVMVAYALAGARAGRWLSAAALRWTQRSCAVGMWLLAAGMALWRR